MKYTAALSGNRAHSPILSGKVCSEFRRVMRIIIFGKTNIELGILWKVGNTSPLPFFLHVLKCEHLTYIDNFIVRITYERQQELLMS